MSNTKELVVNNNYGIDQSIWSTLKNSIYPGAKDESIAMAWEYCLAAKLDILQKPVHIVPMNVMNSVYRKYEFRDVVMPGIGLYRIQAARSGQYVGITAPEFGEEVTSTLDGVTVTYPAWCRITVKRAIGNFIAEFTAVELWRENYATKKDSVAPNTMWKKRPFGQLAKCAEAQALRKGFQEFVTQQPTAEEMEGKFIDVNEIQNLTLKTDSLNSKLDSMLLKQEEKENTDNITIDKHSELQKLIENNRIPLETVSKWCEKAGVERLNELDKEKVLACINYAEKYGHREAA